MEPCRDSTGRQHAVAPPLWSSQQARAVWWILVRQDDENRPISFSVLIFCGVLTIKQKGHRDEKNCTGVSDRGNYRMRD